MLLQNALTVLKTTQPTTRAAQFSRRKKSSTPSNRVQNNFNSHTTNVQSNHSSVRTFPNHTSTQTQTYAQATSNPPAFAAPPPSTDTQPPDLIKLLTNFLDEFKNVINPLIYLLTKVISKLLDK